MTHLRKPGPGRTGSAMVLSLLVITVVAGLAFLTLTTSTSAVGYAKNKVDVLRLTSAATSAANLVAERVWDGFVASSNGKSGDLASFRAFLASDKNGLGGVLNDAQKGGGTLNGCTALALPTGEDGLPHLAGAAIGSVSLRRTDAPERTDLEIGVTAQASAAAGAPRQSIRQVVSVEGPVFKGFEFALLSNNVNCIMCHAAFDIVCY